MNKKSWIVISFFVVSVIIAIFAYQFLSQPKLTFSGPERIKDNPQSLPEGVPDPNDSTILDKLAALKKVDPRLAMAKFRASGANAPIEFYAKLVDQYNEPIVNAEIRIEIGQAALGGGWERVVAETKSDQNGQFKLSDIRGEKHVVTSIKKPGYLFNQSVKKLFWTWPRTEGMKIETTTENKPWIYKGWKIEKVAELTDGNTQAYVEPEGNYYIRLNGGNDFNKIQNYRDGNMKVLINKQQGESHFDPVSWSVSIEVIDGGIIQHSDSYAYLAPEAGYKSIYSETSIKNTSNWKPKFSNNFYFKIGTNYGKANIIIDPFFNDTARVVVIYSINTTGSRNLVSNSN